MDTDTLIIENMGRLTLAARKLSRNFGIPDMMDDLIQEGSLALMEAAERYDTSGEIPFDAYSGRIIKSAMLDYIYLSAPRSPCRRTGSGSCGVSQGFWRTVEAFMRLAVT